MCSQPQLDQEEFMMRTRIVVLVVTSLAAIAALGSLGSRKPNSAFENSQAPYLMGSATDHGSG